MNKLSNSFLFRSITISIVSIVVLNVFLWKEIAEYNLSEIKTTAHLKVKAALKVINTTSFENGNSIQLEKDAATIKKITALRTTLIARNGIVLGDSEVPFEKLREMENHISRPEVISALRKHVGFAKRESATLGTNFYYYCEPVLAKGKIIGFVRLALFSSDYDKKINFGVKLIIVADIIIILFLIILFTSLKSLLNKKAKALYNQLENRKRLTNYELLSDSYSTPFKDIALTINQIFDNINLEKKVLQRDNKNLHNIINSLNEGIAAFHCNGLLGFSNKNFTKILNLTDNFGQTDHAYNIIKFPPLLKDINKFKSKKTAIKKSIEYYDNKYLNYKINKFKFDKEDIGFIIIVQNITKLHNLQRIRSDFVANVSHEFKTPLTSIRGYSETLLSGSVKDSETKIRFLQKIRNQSVYLENLVSDLLKLNKIESKGFEDITKVNICPIIDEIASEFKIKAHGEKINFSYQSDCSNGFIVNANTKLIYNIIANLLANSIQYSNQNGNIFLSVKSENDKVYIEVKDDGIGIPDKDKPRIFERFFRVDKASEIYSEGSGLGLSIVKNAVELLSGKFGFESEENIGSLFWIELKKATS